MCKCCRLPRTCAAGALDNFHHNRRRRMIGQRGFYGRGITDGHVNDGRPYPRKRLAPHASGESSGGNGQPVKAAMERQERISSSNGRSKLQGRVNGLRAAGSKVHFGEWGACKRAKPCGKLPGLRRNSPGHDSRRRVLRGDGQRIPKARVSVSQSGSPEARHQVQKPVAFIVDEISALARDELSQKTDIGENVEPERIDELTILHCRIVKMSSRRFWIRKFGRSYSRAKH